MVVQTESRRRCSTCGRSFSFPAGDTPPEQCPNCRPTAKRGEPKYPAIIAIVIACYLAAFFAVIGGIVLAVQNPASPWPFIFGGFASALIFAGQGQMLVLALNVATDLRGIERNTRG